MSETAVAAIADEWLCRIDLRPGRLAGQLKAEAIFDRSGHRTLAHAGRMSAGGACRLIKASDGWFALSLPRPEDFEDIPALLHAPVAGDAWDAVEACSREKPCDEMVARGILLGLPIARVGEAAGRAGLPAVHRAGAGGAIRPLRRVVDMSALWAGPLCAKLLGQGAETIKIEGLSRADGSRHGTPGHYRELNDDKELLKLDFGDGTERARLLDLVAISDVLITSSRPAGLDRLGLSPGRIFARNPSLIWVAITAHGWSAPFDTRTGFGDDAAAAGGLLRIESDGTPHFMGDALADPLTGIAAAMAAFDALDQGGGAFIDAAMAPVAAHVAARARP